MEKAETQFKANIDMIDMLEEMIGSIRRQNFNRADRLLRVFLPRFSDSMTDVLSPAFDEYGMGDLDMRAEIVTGILKDVLASQQMGDYVLLADQLELNMLPFMLNVQDALRGHIDLEHIFSDISAGPDRIGLTGAGYFFDKETGAYEKTKDAVKYTLEQTSQGNFTLKISNEEEEYYLHSNIAPTEEGRRFADQYYELEAREYVIYGIGLGYHVKALCDKCHGVKVTVFESDGEIFDLNKRLGILDSYKDKGLTLIFDPDHRMLLEKLTSFEGYVLALHYPSIRLIKNKDIRDRMRELFVQDSSIRNQLPEMTANFYRNIGYCSHYADELEGKIKGRTVYIAAAGPSLDESMEVLKEASSDAGSLIMVVGTAYRKIVQSPEIKPDFAIVLDAADRIYNQVRGLTEDKTPFIICSTACADIARDMAGEKYLACQKDFEKAEKYARDNNRITFESGGSVSTLAFDIAVRLGARRIVLAGLDLAYPDNKMHAEGTSVRDLSDDKAGLIMIDSTDGGKVYTTTAMNMYKRWFEKRIEDGREEMGEAFPEVINLSRHGALIKGMQNEL